MLRITTWGSWGQGKFTYDEVYHIYIFFLPKIHSTLTGVSHNKAAGCIR